MHYDEVIEKLGSFGRYQQRIYFLLCLPAIPCALHMLSSVFIAATPEFRCAIPGYNDTYAIQNENHSAYINAFIPKTPQGTYDQCKLYTNDSFTWALYMQERNVTMNLTDADTVQCTKWVYDTSVFEETIITKLDLVCQNQGKSTIATVVFMAGVLVGAFLFGILSDVIGRKKTLMIAFCLQAVSGVACSFAPEYYSFILLRFVLGASNSGIFMTAFVIGIELVGPSMRLVAGIVIEYFFALGYVVLTGLAYFIRHWTWLQFACSVPSFLFLSYWWFIPESSRWLMAKGRREEAEKILRHSATVNGVRLPEKLFDDKTEEKEDSSLSLSQLPGELIKAPTLLIRSLIIFFNWLVVSMVYYGLSLNSGNLGGDIFFNFLLSGLVEFPGYTFCFACKWLGRKGPHAGNMILGGVACISTIFIVFYYNSDNTSLVALSMIGKFGTTVGFAIIYFWSAEIYPTVVRNGLMGMSSVFARVGGMISAPIADLGKLIKGDLGVALPQIIFGSLTIAAGLLSLWLPETTNKTLPQTIAEGEKFGKKDTSPSSETDKDVQQGGVYLVSRKRSGTEDCTYSNPILAKEAEARI